MGLLYSKRLSERARAGTSRITSLNDRAFPSSSYHAHALDRHASFITGRRLLWPGGCCSVATMDKPGLLSCEWPRSINII